MMHRRTGVIFFVGMVLSAGVAAAEPPGTTPVVGMPNRGAPACAGCKSVASGVLLSISSTVLGQLLLMGDDASNKRVYAGMAIGLIGPSVGHFYAGRYWTPGLSLRVVGAGLLFAYVESQERRSSTGLSDEYISDEDIIMALGFAALFAGGAILDFATVHQSVDEYNRIYRARAPTISVLPVHTRDGLAPGLGVSGRF